MGSMRFIIFWGIAWAACVIDEAAHKDLIQCGKQHISSCVEDGELSKNCQCACNTVKCENDLLKADKKCGEIKISPAITKFNSLGCTLPTDVSKFSCGGPDYADVKSIVVDEESSACQSEKKQQAKELVRRCLNIAEMSPGCPDASDTCSCYSNVINCITAAYAVNDCLNNQEMKADYLASMVEFWGMIQTNSCDREPKIVDMSEKDVPEVTEITFKTQINFGEVAKDYSYQPDVARFNLVFTRMFNIPSETKILEKHELTKLQLENFYAASASAKKPTTNTAAIGDSEVATERRMEDDTAKSVIAVLEGKLFCVSGCAEKQDEVAQQKAAWLVDSTTFATAFAGAGLTHHEVLSVCTEKDDEDTCLKSVEEMAGVGGGIFKGSDLSWPHDVLPWIIVGSLLAATLIGISIWLIIRETTDCCDGDTAEQGWGQEEGWGQDYGYDGYEDHDQEEWAAGSDTGCCDMGEPEQEMEQYPYY